MKKLMIMAAAVAVAAVTQAASVNWAVSTGVETDFEGYSAYCFFSDVGGSTTYKATTLATAVADLKAGTIASAFMMALDDFGDGLTSYAEDTGWGTDSTVGGYAILINAAELKDATKYTVLTADDITFSDAADQQSFGLTYDAETWQDIKGPEPTPEPTSAMLMLLGVAGLALRRKQK